MRPPRDVIPARKWMLTLRSCSTPEDGEGRKKECREEAHQAGAVQRGPWWHQRAFCQLAGSLLHSELRQQRATASPTPWTVYRREVASSGHTGARRGVQLVSG